MKALRVLAGCLLFAGAVLSSGCVSFSIGEHAPTPKLIVQLRDSGIAQMRVGEFKAAPTLPAASNQHLSIRGAAFSSGDSATFAQYLGNAVAADLRAAGKFDVNSAFELRGLLQKNELRGGGTKTGTGSLGAQFQVWKGGKQIYSNDFSVDSSWESSFFGMVALQNGMNRYAEMYNLLLEKLYSDPAFLAACKSQ